jgi:hypothetical protein
MRRIIATSLCCSGVVVLWANSGEVNRHRGNGCKEDTASGISLPADPAPAGWFPTRGDRHRARY